jgi:uncharacterized protein (TIGR02996 family)
VVSIVVGRNGVSTTEIELDKAEIRVGSAPESDVVVRGAERHHCTIEVRAAGCFLISRSDAVTDVNGKPAYQPTALYASDKVRIADYTLVVEFVSPGIHPIEDQLLAAIESGDDASRDVYADWLDENCDPRRAEFLRIDHALVATPDDARLLDRLRHLAFLIDVDWRRRVANMPVEYCARGVRSGFECDQRWNTLARTVEPGARECRRCRELVYYCETMNEAKVSVREGRSIVVDPANGRTTDDLYDGDTRPLTWR